MKTTLKALVSLLILAYLFSKLDFWVFLNAVGQTQWAYFLLACLGQYLVLILPACSLKILSTPMGLNLPIRTIYTINLQSMFYSLLVPGDVAAGVARFVKFSKAHRGPKLPSEKIRGMVLAVMATDRFFTMGALILSLFPLLFIAPLPEKTIWFQRVGLILSALFVGIFLLLYQVKWDKVFWLLPKRFRRLGDYGIVLAQALHDFPLSTLGLCFGLALAFHASTIILVDINLMKSLGLTLPWLQFASIVIAVRFLRYIPFTYSGIGLREFFYPLALQAYHIPMEKALALGLLGTLTSLLPALIGGVWEGYDFFAVHKQSKNQTNAKNSQ